ncbi:MAG: MarR family winged helix-turn-helix transcriptional regulator [Flavobacteriaceae bacterium]
MQKEITIDHTLRATWQAVAKMYNEQAAQYDSTMAAAFVLLNIDIEHGTPSTSLGPNMGMEATSLSRILKTLEDREVIYRERNPNDGRSVLIKLTELGLEKRALSRSKVIQFNEAIRSRLTETQIANFFQVTEVIQELVHNKEIF